MVTQETKIPEESLLKTEEQSFDYIDSFQCTFKERIENIDIDLIAELFVSSGPNWANTLMKIRDKLVKPFGLKTSDELEEGNNMSGGKMTYEVGDQCGIFKVIDKAEDEIILGGDDKHLNVKVSLLLESICTSNKKLSITTVVKYNNLFGRLYFLPVRPFHKLIVRKTVENIIRKVEQQ